MSHDSSRINSNVLPSLRLFSQNDLFIPPLLAQKVLSVLLRNGKYPDGKIVDGVQGFGEKVEKIDFKS